MGESSLRMTFLRMPRVFLLLRFRYPALPAPWPLQGVARSMLGKRSIVVISPGFLTLTADTHEAWIARPAGTVVGSILGTQRVFAVSAAVIMARIPLPSYRRAEICESLHWR
jgi:hypothetical protein